MASEHQTAIIMKLEKIKMLKTDITETMTSNKIMKTSTEITNGSNTATVIVSTGIMIVSTEIPTGKLMKDKNNLNR